MTEAHPCTWNDSRSRTWLTTCEGQQIDLLDPLPEQISFEAIGEHLAKANRYCGATVGQTYSVAEHSVRCADAADAASAPYLLCHDMHEAYLGDDTTPKKRALAAIISSFGVLSRHIEDSFNMLTDRLDVAIHAAAGLPFPPAPDIQEQIHHFDRVLLATEWRDLMLCPPPYDFEAEPLPGKIVPWRWTHAQSEFVHRCQRLLPALRQPSRRIGSAA